MHTAKKNACGKNAYHSEQEARQVAAHQMSVKPGLKLRVYHCDACRY